MSTPAPTNCPKCGRPLHEGYGAAGAGELDLYEACDGVDYNPAKGYREACAFFRKPPEWLTAALEKRKAQVRT